MDALDPFSIIDLLNTVKHFIPIIKYLLDSLFLYFLELILWADMRWEKWEEWAQKRWIWIQVGRVKS